jgi:hypothetical protein
VLLAAVSAARGGGGDVVVPGAPGPDTPSSVHAPPVQPEPDLQPTRVPVVPGAVDLRPRPFDSAEALGDGRLAVRFWGGVAPCSVVGRVDVEETAERVTVTLFTGRQPTPEPVACIELAVYQEVVVDLAAPVGDRAVVDGAG